MSRWWAAAPRRRLLRTRRSGEGRRGGCAGVASGRPVSVGGHGRGRCRGWPPQLAAPRASPPPSLPLHIVRGRKRVHRRRYRYARRRVRRGGAWVGFVGKRRATTSQRDRPRRAVPTGRESGAARAAALAPALARRGAACRPLGLRALTCQLLQQAAPRGAGQLVRQRTQHCAAVRRSAWLRPAAHWLGGPPAEGCGTRETPPLCYAGLVDSCSRGRREADQQQRSERARGLQLSRLFHAARHGFNAPGGVSGGTGGALLGSKDRDSQRSRLPPYAPLPAAAPRVPSSALPPASTPCPRESPATAAAMSDAGANEAPARPRLNLKPRDPEAAKKLEMERLNSGGKAVGPGDLSCELPGGFRGGWDRAVGAVPAHTTASACSRRLAGVRGATLRAGVRRSRFAEVCASGRVPRHHAQPRAPQPRPRRRLTGATHAAPLLAATSAGPASSPPRARRHPPSRRHRRRRTSRTPLAPPSRARRCSPRAWARARRRS